MSNDYPRTPATIIIRTATVPGDPPNPSMLETNEVVYDGNLSLYIKRANGTLGQISGVTATTGGDGIDGILGLRAALNALSPLVHYHQIIEVTGLSTALDQLAGTDHNHTVSEVTGLQGSLNNKANVGHQHAMASITGVTAFLNTRAATSHYHTVEQISDLNPADYSDIGHTHSISGITNLQSTLDGKSNSVHTHPASMIPALPAPGNPESQFRALATTGAVYPQATYMPNPVEGVVIHATDDAIWIGPDSNVGYSYRILKATTFAKIADVSITNGGALAWGLKALFFDYSGKTYYYGQDTTSAYAGVKDGAVSTVQSNSTPYFLQVGSRVFMALAPITRTEFIKVYELSTASGAVLRWTAPTPDMLICPTDTGFYLFPFPSTDPIIVYNPDSNTSRQFSVARTGTSTRCVWIDDKIILMANEGGFMRAYSISTADDSITSIALLVNPVIFKFDAYGLLNGTTLRYPQFVYSDGMFIYYYLPAAKAIVTYNIISGDCTSIPLATDVRGLGRFNIPHRMFYTGHKLVVSCRGYNPTLDTSFAIFGHRFIYPGRLGTTWAPQTISARAGIFAFGEMGWLYAGQVYIHDYTKYGLRSYPVATVAELEAGTTYFGRAVAIIDATNIAIGAFKAKAGTTTEGGAVFIVRRASASTNDWSTPARITIKRPDGLSASDYFGVAIAYDAVKDQLVVNSRVGAVLSTFAWQTSTALPAARIDQVVLTLQDGRIIAATGVSSAGADTSNVYIATVSGAVLTWTEVTAYPVAVRQVTGAITSDGRVFMVGGLVGSGLINSCYLGIVTDNTINWVASTAFPVSLRYQIACTLPDGRIVVAGGLAPGNSVDTVYIGTISGNSISWVASTALPEPRSQHAAVTLPDGRILIVAGCRVINSGPIVATSVCWIGTVSGNTITWITTTRLPVAIRGHKVNLRPNGNVVVSGGYDGNVQTVNYVFEGVVSGDTISWTNGTSLPAARTLHGAAITKVSATSEGLLVVTGGRDTAAVARAETYAEAYNRRVDTGNLYFFGRNQGGANNWGHVRTLLNPDPANSTIWGYRLSIGEKYMTFRWKPASSAVVWGVFKRDQWGEFDTTPIYTFAPNDQLAAATYGDLVVTTTYTQLKAYIVIGNDLQLVLTFTLPTAMQTTQAPNELFISDEYIFIANATFDRVSTDYGGVYAIRYEMTYDPTNDGYPQTAKKPVMFITDISHQPA